MNNRGFTLIELLVAMGIIAVLTGMAAFNFNQSRVRARDVQRKNDLNQLQKALELYKNDTGSYPDPDTGDYQTILLGPGEYIKNTFSDPKGTEWVTYQYKPASGLKSYYLMACLENPADATKETDTAICQNFTADVTDICSCGNPTKTGAMYIISNP